ncbi:MAG: ThiF family adenylyltransferase [Magnetococcales bacterium]|nr:ThiF family adenylyltransferase [Magnetococcales bacterium]
MTALPPDREGLQTMDGAWLERYSRQLLLKEVGGEGQLRLQRATVGVIGAAAMGSPLILYLAAAGIGHLVVLDSQRAAPLCAAVQALNPWVKTTALCAPAFPEQMAAEMRHWDLAIWADGGADSGTASLWQTNKAALQTGKTLLAGWLAHSVYPIFLSRAGHDSQAPCLLCAEWACSAREASSSPDPTLVRTGAGVVGAVLAMESLLFLLDRSQTLWYGARVFYPEEGRFNAVSVPKNPVCPACLGHPHG